MHTRTHTLTPSPRTFHMQELLSMLNSPCTTVKFDDVEKALIDAEAFDTTVKNKMKEMMKKVDGENKVCIRLWCVCVCV